MRLKNRLAAGLVATLLQQDIEFGTVLINSPPQQIRLAAQRHKYFVQMPGGAGLAASGLHAVGKARAKFVAPSPNRFVTDDNPALEQLFLDVAQA
ncbi:hypothetical protein AWB65_06384 [Caballeronia humi]|uniref:Uncharacterized protein n=1 Tax=Caballeronia humi TaxID=326474 RepID=A0A158JD08_9BURK|nr:hypothetical protein AWB65_06384 [Caballeronia humi]